MKQDDISRADTAYARYMARQSSLLAQRIIAVRSGESEWMDVLRGTCSEHHVLPQDVLHGGRCLPIQKARAQCMKRLHKQGHSLSQIGRWMGRGHDTVLRTITGSRTKGA